MRTHGPVCGGSARPSYEVRNGDAAKAPSLGVKGYLLPPLVPARPLTTSRAGHAVRTFVHRKQRPLVDLAYLLGALCGVGMIRAELFGFGRPPGPTGANWVGFMQTHTPSHSAACQCRPPAGVLANFEILRHTAGCASVSYIYLPVGMPSMSVYKLSLPTCPSQQRP